MRKDRPRHWTASVNGWLCRLGCSSADSLPSSKYLLSCRIEESDCQSMAETQSFIDKSVCEWRRRLVCASLLYGIMSFARWRHFIFQSWFNYIISHNVHNEVTLICAKFGADLVTISKDTDHKTKWPRFLAYPVSQRLSVTVQLFCTTAFQLVF